ncbi:DUF7287 family protein [Natronococcus occultus]|uniref:Pilin/flagellin n=1 Tax=Natronococcus occultus SP4 TaxID=694430 RepID=L0JW36_9EURY|nr:hypothetical protein [Natronococcus occultus]AGB36981.1 hypothetical protein Natoc_1143 [Natronococcus occultus SP4]
MAGDFRATDRGQTAQDFAVGISIFLLAVALVFAALPTLAAPSDAAEAERERAERIADRLVAEFATHGELDGERFVAAVGTEGGDRDRPSGIADDGVDVRLERLDGGELELADGGFELATEPADRDGRPAASAARIVSLDSSIELEDSADDPAYRLVVEVTRT